MGEGKAQDEGDCWVRERPGGRREAPHLGEKRVERDGVDVPLVLFGCVRV